MAIVSKSTCNKPEGVPKVTSIYCTGKASRLGTPWPPGVANLIGYLYGHHIHNPYLGNLPGHDAAEADTHTTRATNEGSSKGSIRIAIPPTSERIEMPPSYYPQYYYY